MWALNILGVGQSADERAIKRAYAKLLKQARPDENPTEFQRLHEAYQAALNWRRENSLPTTEVPIIIDNTPEQLLPIVAEVNDFPIEPSTDEHHELSSTSYDDTNFSFSRYYLACMKIAANGDHDILQQWLIENTPTLLQSNADEAIKQDFLNFISNSFISFWQKRTPPLSNNCFDTIIDFFKFATTINNKLILKDLRNNLHYIWLAKQQGRPQTTITTDTESIENHQTISTFNFQAFYQQCIKIAQHQGAKALTLWLNDHIDLWVLETKQTAANLLLQSFEQNPRPLHKNCFKVLIHFFGFDNVFDLTTLQNMQNYLHSLWLFDPERIKQLKEQGQGHNRFSFYQDDYSTNWKMLEQLQEPFSWSQLLSATFPSWRATHWSKNTNNLLIDTNYVIPEHIDIKQLNYWLNISHGPIEGTSKLIYTSYSVLTTLITTLLTIFIISFILAIQLLTWG